ncbi:MAG: hypothetical protein MUF27_11750, partial [Acidobacteria bacterium]|nr:hypothetical protein [Acidobacteriota bacterium]
MAAALFMARAKALFEVTAAR